MIYIDLYYSTKQAVQNPENRQGRNKLKNNRLSIAKICSEP